MDARRIDALLHEHLFRLPAGIGDGMPWHPERYSTTWDGLGDVVAAMGGRGYQPTIARCSDHGRHPGMWWSIWHECPGTRTWDSYADTAPMAVALAALKALGVKVDGDG